MLAGLGLRAVGACRLLAAVAVLATGGAVLAVPVGDMPLAVYVIPPSGSQHSPVVVPWRESLGEYQYVGGVDSVVVGADPTLGGVSIVFGSASWFCTVSGDLRHGWVCPGAAAVDSAGWGTDGFSLSGDVPGWSLGVVPTWSDAAEASWDWAWPGLVGLLVASTLVTGLWWCVHALEAVFGVSGRKI